MFNNGRQDNHSQQTRPIFLSELKPMNIDITVSESAGILDSDLGQKGDGFIYHRLGCHNT